MPGDPKGEWGPVARALGAEPIVLGRGLPARVNPLDPALGIDWPTTGRDGKPLEKLLSDKDAAAPTLAEAEQQGVLPSYDEALEFVASLRV